VAEQLEGVVPQEEQGLWLEADNWAGKRKPRDLILELYCRQVQMVSVLANVVASLSLEADGKLPPNVAAVLQLSREECDLLAKAQEKAKKGR
jgi:hypothetical protein